MNYETWLGLAAVFGLSFLVESAVGFGSGLLSVSLGAQVMGLQALFPIFQPLSLLLSLVMMWRGRALLHRAFLLRLLLPAMVPGVVVGMLLFRFQFKGLLATLGVVVMALALFELQKTLRHQVASRLPRWAEVAMLFVAGISHGLFGVSGPPVVYVTSSRIEDKGAFRATLSALWAGLSLLLVVGYALDGTLNMSTLAHSASLLPVLVMAFLLGEWIHRLVPQRAFRLGICVLLVASGAALVIRNA
jgi:uncharacterized protein